MERVSENFVGKHFYCEVLVSVQNLVINVVGYLGCSDNSDLQWRQDNGAMTLNRRRRPPLELACLFVLNFLLSKMLTKFVHVHNISYL